MYRPLFRARSGVDSQNFNYEIIMIGCFALYLNEEHFYRKNHSKLLITI